MKGPKKVVVRIKGGLGNQLFCYAAARRLSILNNAELVIDNVTGFIRDHKYERKYMLGHFNIKARIATSRERLEPFERARRAGMKWSSRQKPYAERNYLEQKDLFFDRRLLQFRVNGTLILDGYWPSEDYFKDVEDTIREDLQISTRIDAMNQEMGTHIRGCESVGIHVRWFEAPGCVEIQSMSTDYYRQAIALVERKIESPHFFLFSDEPTAALAKTGLPDSRVTLISNNYGDEKAYADLWLMSQCRHFIAANSTFSWWGAWLGDRGLRTIVAPGPNRLRDTFQDVERFIPNNWARA